MTALHRRQRHSAALAATGIAAVVGAGIFAAAPASAHTPDWQVDCSTVSVHLTNYNEKPDNTVTITVDGKDLLPAERFGSSFDKKLDLPKHDKPVQVRLVVKANDGDEHNVDDTKTSPVCETESPKPTPSTSTPPASPSPSKPAETPAPESPKPTSPSAEAPSSSTPPAAAKTAGSNSSAPADLAETGSSSNAPMIAGIAAAVVAVGGALVFMARKRRGARD